jgi:hypothetical protein
MADRFLNSVDLAPGLIFKISHRARLKVGVAGNVNLRF